MYIYNYIYIVIYIIFSRISESKHRMPKWTTSLGLLTRMISGLLGMALASCVLQKSSVCYSHCGTFAFDHVLAFFRRPPMTSWNVGVKIAIEEPPFKHNSLWRYFRPGSWSHIPMQLWAFLAPRQSLPGSRPAVSRHQSPWSMDVHGPSKPKMAETNLFFQCLQSIQSTFIGRFSCDTYLRLLGELMTGHHHQVNSLKREHGIQWHRQERGAEGPTDTKGPSAASLSLAASCRPCSWTSASNIFQISARVAWRVPQWLSCRTVAMTPVVNQDESSKLGGSQQGSGSRRASPANQHPQHTHQLQRRHQKVDPQHLQLLHGWRQNMSLPALPPAGHLRPLLLRKSI